MFNKENVVTFFGCLGAVTFIISLQFIGAML
jgi:hypothetical protein